MPLAAIETAIPASKQPQTRITQRGHWERQLFYGYIYGSCSVVSHVQLSYIYIVYYYYYY